MAASDEVRRVIERDLPDGDAQRRLHSPGAESAVPAGSASPAHHPPGQNEAGGCDDCRDRARHPSGDPAERARSIELAPFGGSVGLDPRAEVGCPSGSRWRPTTSYLGGAADAAHAPLVVHVAVRSRDHMLDVSVRERRPGRCRSGQGSDHRPEHARGNRRHALTPERARQGRHVTPLRRLGTELGSDLFVGCYRLPVSAPSAPRV